VKDVSTASADPLRDGIPCSRLRDFSATAGNRETVSRIPRWGCRPLVDQASRVFLPFRKREIWQIHLFAIPLGSKDNSTIRLRASSAADAGFAPESNAHPRWPLLRANGLQRESGKRRLGGLCQLFHCSRGFPLLGTSPGNHKNRSRWRQ